MGSAPPVEYAPVVRRRFTLMRRVLLWLLIVLTLIGSVVGGRVAWRRYDEARKERQRQINEALVVAAFKAAQEKVRALLDAGADPNTRYGKGGQADFSSPGGGWPMMTHRWTPLIELAHSHQAPDRPSIAKLLVERGADVNLDDGKGSTALTMSVASGKEALALYLIEVGANVNAKVGVYIDGPGGMTPLHEAYGHPRLVRALIKHGADVNAMASNGETPLDTAAFRCVWDGGSQEALESLRALLEGGANPDGRGRGWGPLHYILDDVWGLVIPYRRRSPGQEQLAVEAVKALVSAGADVLMPDHKGRSPAEIAALPPDKIKRDAAERKDDLSDADIVSFLRDIKYVESPRQVEVLRILREAEEVQRARERGGNAAPVKDH